MLVPNVVRKSVIFIGGIRDDGAFRPAGTGFIVSSVTGGRLFLHIVTAEHVLNRLHDSGYTRPYIRANVEDGGFEIFATEYQEWRCHQNAEITDVAVLPCHLDRADVIYAHTPLDSIATQNVLDEQHIGVGDEVFAVGLFSSHFGKQRNIPVIRTGHVAAMPEEPVLTKQNREIDAYLVELQSIGGLSGSPVWVHMPPFRLVKGKVISLNGPQYYLLGLMHGHFDVRNLNDDTAADAQREALGNINTGIGVVVPAQKILDIINSRELVESRESIVTRLTQECS